MKHIVFPTYELHPVNPGGAGVLVAGGLGGGVFLSRFFHSLHIGRR